MSSSPQDDSASNSLESKLSGRPQEFVAKVPQTKLLEQILSAAEEKGSDSLENRELQKELEGIANRFGPEKTLDQDVIAEMVRVVTAKIDGLNSPLKETLVDWVAETLAEDPVSRNRLEQIWVKLSRRTGDAT